MSKFDEIKSYIKQYIERGQNVMLMGKHGVGKTAAVNLACQELGLKVWYASAPLLDPDIDFGGIPVPNKKTGTLDFFAKPELFEAEVLFLDELNRASPRTLNMLFEVVQFKSVHGRVLPKLKAVITGINPPGSGAYDVQQLDDALLDRFHAFIEVKPEFPEFVLARFMSERQVKIVGEWYGEYLTDTYVSPRRLEYAMQMFVSGMPLEHAFTDPKVPVGRLREMLGAEELKAAQVERVAEPWEKVWLEPKFQTVINHPELQADHEELVRILKELGISTEDVWKRVYEEREKAGK